MKTLLAMILFTFLGISNDSSNYFEMISFLNKAHDTSLDENISIGECHSVFKSLSDKSYHLKIIKNEQVFNNLFLSLNDNDDKVKIRVKKKERGAFVKFDYVKTRRRNFVLPPHVTQEKVQIVGDLLNNTIKELVVKRYTRFLEIIPSSREVIKCKY